MAAEATGREETGKPRVEIGWLLLGALQQEHEDAAEEARAQLEAHLARMLPDFAWQVVHLAQPEEELPAPVEPVRLLQRAEEARDASGWDFVYAVTPQALAGHERAQPRAATASIFASAVLSLAPHPGGAAQMPLTELALHVFGRLNGLSANARSPLMRLPDTTPPDTAEPVFTGGELAALQASLEAVADTRVEEMAGARRTGRLRFYARSVAQNRRALPRIVLRMRPWSFPARLSRLTTAAASALLVVMMTAESWEVAAGLTGWHVVTLSVLAIGGASIYLLRAQNLLAPGGAALAVALTLGTVLFGAELIGSWTGAAAWPLRATMASFTAALSVSIGALGASFEPYGWFRHVTHVDAEI